MSKALYETEGLRFWSQIEIENREAMQSRLVSTVTNTLKNINKAWEFMRVEGPVLTPRKYIDKSYTSDDIFKTNLTKNNEVLCLRPETTKSSYLMMPRKQKLPICIWQSGKSFRIEKSDGATAAKLRFNEFWQLEFQCIYSVGTMADYRSKLIEQIEKDVFSFTGKDVRTIESERIPSYSTSTIDIEVTDPNHNNRWVEVASCSLRNDFSLDTIVCEIAIGMDRLVELSYIGQK